MGVVEEPKVRFRTVFFRAYDVFETDDVVQIVLEYAQGGSLLDRLGNIGRFSEADAAVVLEQCCGALAFLHQHGIIHGACSPIFSVPFSLHREPSLNHHTGAQGTSSLTISSCKRQIRSSSSWLISASQGWPRWSMVRGIVMELSCVQGR